ncbi:TetR family transcriptional regulator C-terminal domain-containing protein [Streptomyces hygroscopicus subsp. hygroscopicus]|uniref:TetR/AcrR family transcriptional regulator n=1 Tax=Streptomyces hygroscopicus TaxID=1912 RepID=UPI001C661651|nr:TetR/AcrR family transcriptional regulator [Streptomyces hygroscopicus]MBW8087065.1 TetR family transcriptional regulator C-terminal domain-containing protein [Streptomyces hygroscopicus subsp. hygroscopicus]
MRQQFDVAERVRQVIGKAGCTQREFARRVVMDPSKLSRSLSGSRRFTVAELARIADAGNVDAGWLLGTTATDSTTGGGSVGTTTTDATVGGGATDGASGADGASATDGTSRADGGAHRAAGAPRPPAPATAPPEGGRPLQIVRETVRLIAEHGFHAVRVADIAAACDTSTATIHYHFPGRAELLEAAVRWCMDEDTVRRAARIAEADDAREELRQLIALQVPYSERQRQQWLVWLDLWAEAARSTAIGRLHADFYRQWRQTVAEVIRRGIEQGVFRTVDPEFSALRLTALIDGLATQVLATAPGEHGTSPEDMDIACNAYVDTELTARRPRTDQAGPSDRPEP